MVHEKTRNVGNETMQILALVAELKSLFGEKKCIRYSMADSLDDLICYGWDNKLECDMMTQRKINYGERKVHLCFFSPDKTTSLFMELTFLTVTFLDALLHLFLSLQLVSSEPAPFIPAMLCM